MDADLQDSPDEIPELYRMITEDGYDLVSGWKKKRYDPLSKTIPTKLFNATARRVSGIRNLHDFNCGLKAYRQAVVKHIEVYGDMHRYIPYLAKNAGYKRIGEKVVHHQGPPSMAYRNSAWTDSSTATLISAPSGSSRSSGIKADAHLRPARLADVPDRLHRSDHSTDIEDPRVDEFRHIPFLPHRRVYFYLSLAAMTIGVQFFCTGFIGEMITRNAPERNSYLISGGALT